MREGYIRKSISEICDKASSNIAQNKIADIDGDYPVYGASGYVQNVDFYHRDTDYIGIVKDGSGVGRVNVYPAYSSLLGTMQYIIPKDGYHLGYVAYALKGLNLSSFASGAAIPHIYFKDYGKCKIDVPPLSEQQRIVSELDLLSSIIEKKKAQLKEYDQLAQSIFYDMFGDPVTNEKGWEVKKLGEICTKISDGPFGSNLKSEHYVDYGIRVIRLQNIGVREFIDKDKAFISFNHYNSLQKYTCYPNDVVIGTLGDPNLRACKIPLNLKISIHKADCVHIVPNEKIALSDYYVGLLNTPSFVKAKSNAVHGQTRGRINYGQIKQFAIPLPPLSLQQSFASKIESIERQKALIQQSIKEVQMLFDSRMDYYFN